MGLSLLLVARCDPHPDRFGRRRLSKRSQELARMALARNCRQRRSNANHVRCPRRTPSGRARNPLVIGLRKFKTSAHRQCRVWSISARCLWRSPGDDVSSAPGRNRKSRDRLASASRLDEFSRIKLEQARRRHLGSARRSETFHPLQNDGVGGFRSRG